MKKTIALIATGSLVALATPAIAQSAADSPFNGPRIGVVGGYDQSGAGSSIDDDTDDNNNDQSIEGIGYGVEAGYDIDTGGAVIGLEGEYRYSNYSEAEIDLEGTLADSERFDVDLDRHQVMAAVGWRF